MKKKGPHAPIKKKYTTGQPGRVSDAVYFYYDTAPDYNDQLAIVCGGFEKCAPDFDIDRSNYPYFFIKYTIKGSGTLEIGSRTHTLRPGSLSGFEPATPHHYQADPNNPMEHIFVTFLGNDAGDLFEKSKLAERHVIDVSDPEEIHRVFQKILQIGLDKPVFSQEICCLNLRMILLELASEFSRSQSHNPLSKITYHKCREYIDGHFTEIKTPREVAEHCCIDVRYMSALFKKYCHIPPSQYLMRLKLNKAANLLLNTEATIKEIAFRIGFDDPYHFSKNFKEFHGRSPQLYREQHMHSR